MRRLSPANWRSARRCRRPRNGSTPRGSAVQSWPRSTPSRRCGSAKRSTRRRERGPSTVRPSERGCAPTPPGRGAPWDVSSVVSTAFGRGRRLDGRGLSASTSPRPRAPPLRAYSFLWAANACDKLFWKGELPAAEPPRGAVCVSVCLSVCVRAWGGRARFRDSAGAADALCGLALVVTFRGPRARAAGPPGATGNSGGGLSVYCTHLFPSTLTATDASSLTPLLWTLR